MNSRNERFISDAVCEAEYSEQYMRHGCVVMNGKIVGRVIIIVVLIRVMDFCNVIVLVTQK